MCIRDRSLHRERSREQRVAELDRDLTAILLVRPLGEVDRTHAALPDRADDAIWADAATVDVGAGFERVPNGAADQLSETLIGSGLRGNECLDLGAQGAIRGAFGLEVGCALCWREQYRVLEQELQADEPFLRHLQG